MTFDGDLSPQALQGFGTDDNVHQGGGSYSPQARWSVGLEVGYTGHRHDPETGLIYARNRYIRTDWGRFMTLDPLGPWADRGNLGNGCGYVGNMPTTGTDPSGLFDVIHGGGGGGESGIWCGYPGYDGPETSWPEGNEPGEGSSPTSRPIQCCQDPQPT